MITSLEKKAAAFNKNIAMGNLIDCLGKSTFPDLEKQRILAHYDRHLEAGVEEKQAGLNATEDYNKDLQDDMNELNRAMKVPEVKYADPGQVVAAKIKEINDRYGKQPEKKTETLGEKIKPTVVEPANVSSTLTDKRKLLNLLNNENAEPIIADDKAENDRAVQQLTDKDNIEQEPGIKAIEGQAEGSDKTTLHKVIQDTDTL